MTARIRDFVRRGALPLVGREREMRTLVEAFTSLLEGEARSVWLCGVPGSGKSRLLEELRTYARDGASRALVLHAKWYEGEGMELGPLGNALEVLRPSLTASVASRVFRDGSIATVETAIEALQIASRRYPVVLILDDLHYLQSSRELERFIAALEEITLLVIATTRPSDNLALRALRTALTGSIPPLDLEIGPLDGAAIAEAAETLFGTPTPAPMLEQIAALSGGIPLTLREVLRELLASGHVAEGDDLAPAQWRTSSLDEAELRALGDRVHGFSGRLAALPETERRLLALASFLGEQFNRDLLRALAERLFTWDTLAFERLIVEGLIALATPTSRLGTRELEPRTCFAFVHTLLWKATATTLASTLPPRADLARTTLELLVAGTGELYTTAPLDGLDARALDAGELAGLFDWLVAVDRRLAPIYSESYVALCQTTLEPMRRSVDEPSLEAHYLGALASYGTRLYVIGAEGALSSVAAEITSILSIDDATDDAHFDRLTRLEAALVVGHDALRRGQPEAARDVLASTLEKLPPPAEQNDLELRRSAEAVRLLASEAFARGDFASEFERAAPFIAEMDRMRPEALNAFLKVFLYSAIRIGRSEEASAMAQAGLRVRREADLFTEYELLRHAANLAKQRSDVEAVREYATAMRELVDRYPTHRNLSSNYFYLPWVAGCNGDVAELARLEHDFRAVPPPARSSREQIAIARLQFLREWNRVGQYERALVIAEELRAEWPALSPLIRRLVEEEELRSRIDADDGDGVRTALERIESDTDVASGQRAYLDGTLVPIARAVIDPSCAGALASIASALEPGIFVDWFRAARLLLRAAESAAAGKRELNDAAYATIERAVALGVQERSCGLVHVHLDRLATSLPKTRLQRFRQAVGEDTRSSESAIDLDRPAAATAGGRVLRTFGALRIEGTDEAGSKLESKTRTLVAVLVVAKLGDARSIGELTRDRLADLLWPDMSSDRAVNNLHATLSYARRFLGGPDTIAHRDGVYELADDLAIDVVQFRECIARANRLFLEGIYFGAANAYHGGIDLADGDFLEGMYADWVDDVREGLRTELATALERLIGIEIERENYGAIPPLADRLLAIDDLHDGAYEALIRSAAARGARREAFSLFKRYEDTLEEYGAGPARRITTLMDRVRAGEA
jgi:DNA-binding SARP family transcriptional activator